MKYLLNSVFAICALVISFSNVSAQSIVLINGAPTKVIIKNSEIAEVLKDDVSSYMDGFDRSINTQISQPAFLEPSPTVQLLHSRKSNLELITKETED